MKDISINVLSGELQVCSDSPKTGFFRDGCCNTSVDDLGCHTVCCVVTAEFLEFSRGRGNDLVTPLPAYGFLGLQPGDRWCLCASRWAEAYQAGCAPGVVLSATHRKTLEHVTLDALRAHAFDQLH